MENDFFNMKKKAIDNFLNCIEKRTSTDINCLVRSLASYITERRNTHEQAKKRGELFNIFEILGVQTKETRLHSAIIVELLNPNGSHGLSDAPLKLFIEKLKNNFYNDELNSFKLNFNNPIKVEAEYHIGFINEDVSEGGRIDIFINDGTNFIAVENKIYAEDQDAQLVRYNNFLIRETVRTGGKKLLLYLNLYGYLPSVISITSHQTNTQLELGTDYWCIGYNEFIMDWLEGCRRIAIDNAIVRETIKQYINTIKFLTGMNDNKEINEKFFELLSNNIPSVCQILSNVTRLDEFLNSNGLQEYKPLANEIIQKQNEFLKFLFDKKILLPLSRWAKDNKLECKYCKKECGGNHEGINFFEESWKNKTIRIEYEAKPYSDAIIGICWKGKEQEIDPKSEKFEVNCKTNNIWMNGYKGIDSFPNITLADFAYDERINKILSDYESQVIGILNIIKNDIQKFKM